MFADSLKINGVFADYLDIIMKRQLLDADLWKHCVDVFSSSIDDHDRGWRGEYWGKMMRGACLVWKVTRSGKLYDTLTQAVEGLLARQESDGRISSYSVENEFYGWDIWARKYVMTGLQHFYDICSDDRLKSRITNALTAHADYIVDRIGEGKINVLDTGLFWGSVNSASILEPFLRLYKDTGDKKYLEFGEYILKTGGCSEGNLIDCVFDGKAPFEFPVQKAYEIMSFFEGVLAYYELTGEKYCLDAVVRFVHSILETDYTAIGSCGCTHELFDNSTIRQTLPSDKIMQETCVTVTLMRLLARLFFATGEKELFDALRKSALNALAGALNANGYEQYSGELKTFLPGMVFDSYSPLCDGRRARGIGGFKRFADGSHFGCCACIASAGFALYPLTCVTDNGNEIRVNGLISGEYVFSRDTGDIKIILSAPDNSSLLSPHSSLSVKVSAPEGISFPLLITTGDDVYNVQCAMSNVQCCQEEQVGHTTKPAMTYGRSDLSPTDEYSSQESKFKSGQLHITHCTLQNDYTRFDGVKNGDEIRLTVTNSLREERINGRSAFSWAGFTLAADESKTAAYVPGRTITFQRNDSGEIIYELLAPESGEQVRMRAKTDRGDLILTDYASAGQDGKSFVTVWF